jgi:ribokinase
VSGDGGVRPVVVIGSINQDLVVSVARHPQPGETVFGAGLRWFPGGKGANQAVAAARYGAPVHLVGAVGADGTGTALLTELRAAGVDTAAVATIASVATGLAVIAVDPVGENTIIVVPGANRAWGPEALTAVALSDLMARSAVVVVSAEIRPDVVDAAVARGQASGARVVLNLAPAVALAGPALAAADPLVVNESEAGWLLDRVVDGVDSASRAARDLALVARSAVVTLGPSGAVWAAGDVHGHQMAPAVAVVDTTGAGDAFVGVLAAELAFGSSLPAAIGGAVRAASMSVTRAGAQSSFVTRAETRPGD